MWRGLGSMNKGPNATIRLVRRQNHAGTTVSWTTVQREKSSHAYKLSSNVQTACSTDSLNNCPKHSILRFSSFALKIYLWLKMCQHSLPCSIVYAHCLLPGRAFASLYVLLFLEEAEIGGRAQEVHLLGFAGCMNLLLFSSAEMFKNPLGQQWGPRSDCSYRSSLFWVHAVCFYT